MYIIILYLYYNINCIVLYYMYTIILDVYYYIKSIKCILLY